MQSADFDNSETLQNVQSQYTIPGARASEIKEYFQNKNVRLHVLHYHMAYKLHQW